MYINTYTYIYLFDLSSYLSIYMYTLPTAQTGSLDPVP